MGTGEQVTPGNRMQSYIEIMDCTLRDGEQTSGVSFLPHEKLMIARMLLNEVNVDRRNRPLLRFFRLLRL